MSFAAVAVCEAIAGAALLGLLNPSVAWLVGLVPFTCALIGGIRIHRLGQRFGNDITDRIDERQHARRDAAYLSAYRLVATAWILSLAYGMAAGSFGLPIPTRPAAYNVLLLVTIFFTVMLPSSILLWTEPDAEQPDDEPDPSSARRGRGTTRPGHDAAGARRCRWQRDCR